ncbi:MAG: hypothetical protein ABS79_01815 [Planctomycetes bacterium SCN 63-9]|nr:MAG: hypothetical protein ABS79_01815 [Planctomycetes bacterium SCN 63-9]
MSTDVERRSRRSGLDRRVVRIIGSTSEALLQVSIFKHAATIRGIASLTGAPHPHRRPCVEPGGEIADHVIRAGPRIVFETRYYHE